MYNSVLIYTLYVRNRDKLLGKVVKKTDFYRPKFIIFHEFCMNSGEKTPRHRIDEYLIMPMSIYILSRIINITFSFYQSTNIDHEKIGYMLKNAIFWRYIGILGQKDTLKILQLSYCFEVPNSFIIVYYIEVYHNPFITLKSLET